MYLYVRANVQDCIKKLSVQNADMIQLVLRKGKLSPQKMASGVNLTLSEMVVDLASVTLQQEMMMG
jgi:hypothetical protein